MGTPAKHNIKIEWSSNFAYAIGLITSDGWLCKGVPQIGLTSKDLEMMENFREALGLKNVIGKHARGGETEKRYFVLSFKSRKYYDFLLDIGLSPAKSKIIKSVAIPNEFFADFLRGLFDGDGTFYSSRDIRWANSFIFKMSFASASKDFVVWLKDRVAQLYGVKGYLHKGAGVINLEYTKGDTIKLAKVMYDNDNILFLSRKYDKIKTAFAHDVKLHPRGKTSAAIA